MAFYMFQASYTDTSIKAMITNKDNRKEAANKAISAAGGKMLSLFFCFGEYDIVAIIEAPDNTTIAGASLGIGSTGAFSKVKTTVLISPEEMSESLEKAEAFLPSYRPATG
ncbi:MAG: GYD domain-containing protein [Deltaproteobacteria bacterium]|nr:GYD domain-containing protein [Deltaproteobacteria bacterium]